MDNTLFLLLQHRGIQFGMVLLVLWLVYRCCKILLDWEMAKKKIDIAYNHDMTIDEKEPYPAFPMKSFALHGIAAFIIYGSMNTVHLWFPRTEVQTRAVNPTIERQHYEKSQDPIAVVPAESDAEKHAAQEAARRARIDEIKEGFKDLPDEE
jgi:hypothetical protein